MQASPSVLAALAVITTTTPLSASNYQVLYSFTAQPLDGAYPQASLTNFGGTLYGTTEGGGTHANGTVFAVNPTTGAETVVFSLNDKGRNPVASLIKLGGKLYGTAYGGGTKRQGTVFSADPKTGREKLVYRFLGGDGANPGAGLINVGGTLYGTTENGGYPGVGAVILVDPNTRSGSFVYFFQGRPNDGADPVAGLINFAGTLYGTTAYGGTGSCYNGCGTVFSVNPTTGAETVVHSFRTDGSDGDTPYASLINVGGTLYGTTFAGGIGLGTVFSVNPTTGAESVVYRFQGGSDGAYPFASLLNVGGTLYGTTSEGGTGKCGGNSGCGTVFSVNPKTGAELVLHSIGGGIDGALAEASLINFAGTLYGTTLYGGTGSCLNYGYYGCGTVFAYTP